MSNTTEIVIVHYAEEDIVEEFSKSIGLELKPSFNNEEGGGIKVGCFTMHGWCDRCLSAGEVSDIITKFYAADFSSAAPTTLYIECEANAAMSGIYPHNPDLVRGLTA